jgi:hypothetical protein
VPPEDGDGIQSPKCCHNRHVYKLILSWFKSKITPTKSSFPYMGFHGLLHGELFLLHGFGNRRYSEPNCKRVSQPVGTVCEVWGWPVLAGATNMLTQFHAKTAISLSLCAHIHRHTCAIQHYSYQEVREHSFPSMMPKTRYEAGLNDLNSNNCCLYAWNVTMLDLTFSLQTHHSDAVNI